MTVEDYVNKMMGARIPRRQAFKALSGGVAGAAILATDRMLARPHPEAPINRSEGFWSREEMQEASSKMTSYKDLPEMKRAGVLLQAIVNDEPNLSKDGGYFVDPSASTNVPNSFYVFCSETSEFKSRTEIKPYGNLEPIPLVKPDGENGPVSFFNSQVTFDGVQISRVNTQHLSDFGFLFELAIQLNTAFTYSEAFKYIEKHETEWLLPKNEKQKRAFILSRKNSGELSGKKDKDKDEYIMDFVNIFSMLPDYENAKKNNRLTKEDIEFLKPFEFFSVNFQNNNLLVKDKEGNTTWTQKDAQLRDTWFFAAKRMAIDLKFPRLHQ